MTNGKLKKSEQAKKSTLWMALSLAWKLGYTIAIPIVLLGFGGAYADKYFSSGPLFLLIGVVAAVVITSVGIYYKVKKIIL